MQIDDLGPRPRDRAGLDAWYRQALAAQSSSGLSVTAFAERLGITPTTLYERRRRARRSLDPDTSRRSLTSSSRDGRSGLLELGRDFATSKPKESLTIRFPGGIQIDVPSSFDVAQLQAVLELLQPC